MAAESAGASRPSIHYANTVFPRPEAARPDCALKAQHLDLMRLLDDVGDGTIAVLTIKHGLPFQAEFPA